MKPLQMQEVGIKHQFTGSTSDVLKKDTVLLLLRIRLIEN